MFSIVDDSDPSRIRRSIFLVALLALIVWRFRPAFDLQKILSSEQGWQFINDKSTVLGSSIFSSFLLVVLTYLSIRHIVIMLAKAKSTAITLENIAALESLGSAIVDSIESHSAALKDSKTSVLDLEKDLIDSAKQSSDLWQNVEMLYPNFPKLLTSMSEYSSGFEKIANRASATSNNIKLIASLKNAEQELGAFFMMSVQTRPIPPESELSKDSQLTGHDASKLYPALRTLRSNLKEASAEKSWQLSQNDREPIELFSEVLSQLVESRARANAIVPAMGEIAALAQKMSRWKSPTDWESSKSISKGLIDFGRSIPIVQLDSRIANWGTVLMAVVGLLLAVCTVLNVG